MNKSYSKGDTVNWKWGTGNASGTVEKVSSQKTHIQSNGSTITRSGRDQNPAIVIKQKDGTKVLKLASELST